MKQDFRMKTHGSKFSLIAHKDIVILKPYKSFNPWKDIDRHERLFLYSVNMM